MAAPYLFYWSIDRFPYLIPSISLIEKPIRLKGDSETVRTTSFEIIYVLSGRAILNPRDYQPGESYPRTAEPNSFFFLPPNISYTLTVLSDNFEYLNICFTLYTSPQKHQSAPMNLSDFFNEPTQNIPIGIRLPRENKIQTDSSAYLSLQQILKHFANRTPGYSMHIQCYLLELILALLQQNSDDFQKILENIDHIGLSSKFSPNTLLPKDCQLKISDLTIWSSNPHKPQENPIMLSTFSTNNLYVLNPTNASLTVERCGEQPANSGLHYSLISASEDTPYHVWFFKTKLTPDLRPYQQTAHLQFFAQCNMSIDFGIVVYNHNIHQCINLNFEISPSDEPQEYCVRILNTDNQSSFSFYVCQTIQYIDKNYHNKIKLEDIAKQIHLNPTYLSTIFHKETGETFNQYLTNHRIANAKRLLKFTNYSINSIALDCGFYDTSHFSRTFTSAVGLSPNAYRKKNKH